MAQSAESTAPCCTEAAPEEAACAARWAFFRSPATTSRNQPGCWARWRAARDVHPPQGCTQAKKAVPRCAFARQQQHRTTTEQRENKENQWKTKRKKDRNNNRTRAKRMTGASQRRQAGPLAEPARSSSAPPPSGEGAGRTTATTPDCCKQRQAAAATTAPTGTRYPTGGGRVPAGAKTTDFFR